MAECALRWMGALQAITSDKLGDWNFYPGSRQAQPLTELNPAAVPICLYSATSFCHEPITAKPRAAGVATLTS